MKNKYLVVVVFIIMFGMYSCVKQEYDGNSVGRPAEFKSGIAVPLAFKTFSLTDYLTDTVAGMELIEDEDGFFTLVYTDTIETVQASDFIRIPDLSSPAININNNTPLPINLSAANPDPIVDSSYLSLSLENTSGAILDSILIESMLLSFQFSSSVNNATITIDIPGLTQNGNRYNQAFPLSQNSATSELNNYTLALSQHPTANSFLVISTIEFQPGNETIAPGENIVQLQTSIENIEYTALFGYIGNIGLPEIGDTILINFARNFDLTSEGYGFKNPELTFGFENTFGLPIGLTFTTFFYNSKNETTISITSPEIPMGDDFLTINYPAIFTAPLKPAMDEITLTPSNSDISDIVSDFPTLFSYSIQSSLNPENNPETPNFIHRESSMEITASLTVPLEAYAHNLLIQDTLDFNLKDLIFTQYENIKSIEFQFAYENYFPFEFGVNMIFLDEFGQVLSSLTNDIDPFDAGTDTDNDGKTDKPGVSNPPISVFIDRDKALSIEEATYIIVQGHFSTQNSAQPEYVKFYSDYRLFVNLGIIVAVETEI